MHLLPGAALAVTCYLLWDAAFMDVPPLPTSATSGVSSASATGQLSHTPPNVFLPPTGTPPVTGSMMPPHSVSPTVNFSFASSSYGLPVQPSSSPLAYGGGGVAGAYTVATATSMKEENSSFGLSDEQNDGDGAEERAARDVLFR